MSCKVDVGWFLEDLSFRYVLALQYPEKSTSIRCVLSAHDFSENGPFKTSILATLDVNSVKTRTESPQDFSTLLISMVHSIFVPNLVKLLLREDRFP